MASNKKNMELFIILIDGSPKDPKIGKSNEKTQVVKY
jgi:hypothetical protein